MVTSASILSFGTSCRNRIGGNGGGTLTADEQAAVNAVVKQLDSSAKALGTVATSFTGLDASGNVTAGQCPVVNAQLASGVLTVSADFGTTPCTSNYYSSTVSGSASLTLNTVSKSLDVVFNDLDIGGDTTSGSGNWTLVRNGTKRTLTGSVDLNTTNVGSASGNLDVQVDVTALTLKITQSNLLITDSTGASYSVSIDELVVDPLQSGNFVPNGGTVSFEIPNTSPPPANSSVVITFTSSSPNTGVVAVSIDGAQAVNYKLPGF